MTARAEQRTSPAAAAADAALKRAWDAPHEARRQAERALALATTEDDGRAAAVAERVLGLAARHDNDLDTAVRHLRRAVRTAERHGLTATAGLARVSLFGTLAQRGEFARALEEAERAADEVTGVDRAVLELQRAAVLRLQGERLDEALDCLRRALPVLRRAGEREAEAVALHNRGLVHCYRGAMAAAHADLVRAEQLRRDLGQPRMSATVRADLGFVAARRGDVPAALAWFDQADAYFREHGVTDPVGLRDRCEVLLRARLVAEAKETAERAVAQLADRGLPIYLAEARAMLAEAQLLAGEHAAAGATARQAARSFARQRRPRNRALATYLEVKAAWLGGDRGQRLLRAARRSADALDAAGWAGPAQDARLIAGRIALEGGHPRIAERELRAAAAVRHRGPVQSRVRGWHAEALRRLATGDRRGAGRALATGIRLVDRHRAVLGATDLRAHATGHAAELAELGLRQALARGRAEGVWQWAERWRAGTVSAPPPRPPTTRKLENALARLRQTANEVERAAQQGRPTASLLRRQAEHERAVQQLARHRRGADGTAGSDTGPPDRDALTAALGDRALVEYVECDGTLYAVTLADGRMRLTTLGDAAEVTREVESLSFALRRLAYARGSPAALDAAEAAFAHGCARLDRLVLAPMSDTVGDAPLVVVPTGALHALAWGALPTCAGRTVSVVPAAGLWTRVARSAARRRPSGATVLVAGPDLAAAEDEAAGLSRRYPQATRLTGGDATVDKVAGALDGAGLAHIAAHCRFRSDNPLLSSLRLADGELTVYDLERLSAAPRQLVLSACESGLADVQPGDELLGFVAALFALGTHSVIASVVPVPDAATQPLMTALHDHLVGGAGPGEALAAVQRDAAARGERDQLAAAAGLVCFGAP